MRFKSLIHLTLSCLLASLMACSGREAPAPLSRAELDTVDELVDFYRLQLLQKQDPDEAERFRESLGRDFDEETLRAHAEALGRDPTRGARVLRAVRDSLESMRNVLLGMEIEIEDSDSGEMVEVPAEAAER